MTSTFLLPFAVGACATAGRMEDAFGIVAIVAMTPLVVVQFLGLIYRKQFVSREVAGVGQAADEVIVFEEAYQYG
jgi:hypothetical protein